MIYIATDNYKDGFPLSKAYDDTIYQKGNGEYYLKFRFPVDRLGVWKHLTCETILKADDTRGLQLFKIKKINKINGYIRVYCKHISDDLNYIGVDKLSVTNATGRRVMETLAGSTTEAHNFIFNSDVATMHTLNLSNTTAGKILSKDKHSIIGQWGGELVRDNFLVDLKARAGVDTEILFMNKKNVKNLDNVISTENLTTRLKLSVEKEHEGKKQTITATVDSPNINAYPRIYTNYLKVTNNNITTQEELIEYGKKYFRDKLVDFPTDNLTVNVIDKNQEQVRLFDTVWFRNIDFNIDKRLKVVAYEYSPMAKRYKKISFGALKVSNLSQIKSLSQLEDKIEEKVSESFVDAFKIQKNLSELLKSDRKGIEDKLVELEEKSKGALEVKKALFEADGTIPDVVKAKILDAVEGDIGRLKTIITEAELIKAIQAKLNYAEIKNALIDKAFINQIISDEKFTQQFEEGQVTTQNIFTKLKDSIKSNISKEFVTKDGVRKLVNDLTIDADGIRQITQQESQKVFNTSITGKVQEIVGEVKKNLPTKEELKGKSSYLHKKYTNDVLAGPMTDNSNSLYIGIYTGDKAVAPTNMSEYEWTRIRGYNGISSYIHRKYSDYSNGASMDDNSSRKYIGIYTGSSSTPPTTANSYLWSKIKGEDGANGVPGVKGADGRTPYFHTAYSNSPTGDRDFSTTNSSNKLYIGTYSDFEVADSTDYRKYKWVKIKGEDGNNGRDGVSSYIYRKYSDNANGSPMSDNSNLKYIGIYTGTSAIAPTLPSAYTWSKIKGEDGAQGVPGARGSDGRTSYLHTAYANSAIGDRDFSTTNSTGKEYIGTYTDFEINDSNDYRRYKWVKIRGENGRNGTDGHSLTANLRFEGKYINSISNNVKAYLDVFYDGQKVSSGFNAQVKYNGGNRTDWSGFWSANVDNVGRITNLDWGNREQNGTPLEAIVLVTYKGLNTVVNARMENIPDIVEIKEITKKYKTFESTIDRFDSTIGEVKKQVLANEEKRNLIIGSRLLNDSDYKVIGKAITNGSLQGVYAQIRQNTSNLVGELYNGNSYLYVLAMNNTQPSWQGVGFKLSTNYMQYGSKYSLRIPCLILREATLDKGIYMEIKNHNTNKVIWRHRLDKQTFPAGEFDTIKGIWIERTATFQLERAEPLSDYSFWIYAVQNGGFCISAPYMCEGDVLPKNYSPAPEDVHLQNSRLESSIKQTKNEIELKVSKDEVIASINASVETTGNGANQGVVKINADKVDINGVLKAYAGEIGGFRLRYFEEGNSQYITGATNWNNGMNNGNAKPTQAGLWVNWGNKGWGTVGDYTFVVWQDGRLQCKNTASFYRNVEFGGGYTVTGGTIDTNYIDIQSNKSGGGKTNVIWWSQLSTLKSRLSDKRLKANIKPTKIKALDLLNKIKMVEFNWKKDNKFEKIGAIAQQVQSVEESFVVHDMDDKQTYNDYLRINYYDTIPYLIKAIQELSTENQQLKSQLKVMNERLTKLEDKINGNL